MRYRYLPLLLVLLGADAPAPGGTITGTVAVIKDGKIVPRDDVYVYLQPAKRQRRARKLPGHGVRKEIRQQGQAFVPPVVVVPVGAEIAFPNYDREEHNVFSPTDPPFDLGRYTTTKSGETHVFKDADEFDIFCDIHRNMWAKVKVVDSGYIVPVKAGAFTIANVPPGEYRVVAWVRDSAEAPSEPITVTAGATTNLAAELHLQLTSRSGCHDRKDGTPYDKYATCPGAR